MHQAADLMNMIADATMILAFLWGLASWSVKLNLIYKEHRPNGGSSMKDRVAKLETVNVTQTAMLGQLQENDRRQDEKLDAIAETLKSKH